MADQINEKPSVVKSPHLGIICVGGCGVNNAYKLAKALDPAEYPHLSMLVLNTDNEQLKKLFGEKAEQDIKRWTSDGRLSVHMLKHMDGRNRDGKGAGGDPEVGRKGVEDARSEIEEFTRSAGEELDAIILVGGLGGGTGTGALPALASIVCKEGGPPVLALATTPLLCEGPKRMHRAVDAKKKLFAVCPTILIHNESLPDKKVAFPAAWTTINDACLVPILKALREIIQTMGDVKNIDLEDYRAVLSAGNYVYFGLAECKKEASTEECSMEELASKLVAQGSFQDTSIVGRSLHLLMWFHGVWTIDQFEELAKAIKSRVSFVSMDQVQDNTEGEINWGMCDAEEGSKWVALIAVAGEVPEAGAVRVAQVTATGPTLVVPPPVVPPPKEKEKMVQICVRGLGNISKLVPLPERLANAYRDSNAGKLTDPDAILTAQVEIEKIVGFKPYMGAESTNITEKHLSKIAAAAASATVQ